MEIEILKVIISSFSSLIGLIIGWVLKMRVDDQTIKLLKEQIRIQEEQKDNETIKTSIDLIMKRLSIETDPHEKEKLGKRLKILDDKLFSKYKK